MTGSLYQLERDGDVDSLLEHLARGDDVVRARSAEILGELDPDGTDRSRVVDGLIGTAAGDTDGHVRAAAIDALARLGGRAVDRLVVALADGTAEGPAPLSDFDALPAYREAIRAERPELRMAAASGLARFDAGAALPPLLAALSDPEPRVRVRAARACGSVGHPGAVEALIGTLEDDHTEVRRTAAESLGMIGTDRALRALLDRLGDPDETVRYVAASGLGAFGSPEPIASLIGTLEDPSPVVRRAATHALVELLSTAPAERSHGIRASIEASLPRSDDESVVRPLLDIIETGTRVVHRRNAIWLLGHLVGERFETRAVDALLGALDDDDHATVQLAVAALLEIGGRTVELRTLALLEDRRLSAAARAKAIFVLGKVGSSRAREPLESIRKGTDDEAIRRQATAALAKLGGRP